MRMGRRSTFAKSRSRIPDPWFLRCPFQFHGTTENTEHTEQTLRMFLDEFGELLSKCPSATRKTVRLKPDTALNVTFSWPGGAPLAHDASAENIKAHALIRESRPRPARSSPPLR